MMSETDARHLLKLCIVADANKLAAELGAHETSGSCIYWTLATIIAAQRNGVSLIPQAGTCYWPRVTPEKDDGVEPNRFGYEWKADPKTASRASDLDADVTIVLPEMHVWAVEPATGEVVDLAARLFPVQCKRIMGLDWKAPHPPDWFWGQGKDTPPLTLYEPHGEATMLADRLMRNVLVHDVAKRLSMR